MTLDRTTSTQNPHSTSYFAMGPPINFSNDFCLSCSEAKQRTFFHRTVCGTQDPLSKSSLSPGLSIRPYIPECLPGAPFPASAGISLTCPHVAQRVLYLTQITSVPGSGCSLTQQVLLQPGR